ncbi:RimK/LysX family protein [Photobacterium leiognathi]|uniref:putative ATP-dependent zinc protease n=1 Tax=Photobacterium leiognathi TaxID=553611 RepID=UPI003DA03495
MMRIVSGILLFLFAGGVSLAEERESIHYAIAQSHASHDSFVPITKQPLNEFEKQASTYLSLSTAQHLLSSDSFLAIDSSSLTLAHKKTHSATSAISKETAEGLYVVGRHEWILLGTSKEYFSAYVDQASKNSRIGVSELVEFEREGKDWVQFVLQGKEYKYAISEWVKDSEKSDEPLPVVKLRTKLGEINEEIEYVLIDGGNGIVLGENFLRDLAVQNAKYDYIQGRVK